MLFFVTVGLEQVHANNFCINFLHHIYYAHYKKEVKTFKFIRHF